jgi:hypothetical protein
VGVWEWWEKIKGEEGGMGLPETVYVKRKDVMRVYGLTRYTVEALDRVKKRILPGRKYGVYLRWEVERVLGKGEAT